MLDVENGNIRLRSNSDGNTGLFRMFDAAGTEAGQIYPASGDLKIYSPNDVLFTQSGNVGIGTSSPTRTFEVNSGTANAAARFESTDSRALIEFKDNAGTASIGNIGTNLTFFPDNATEAMRIDSSGNLGIGMTPAPGGSDTVLSLYNSATPRFRLHNSTTGTTASDGGEINMSGSDFILENREAGNVRFFCNDGERMRIDSSGNVTIGSPSVPSGLEGILELSAATRSAITTVHAGTALTNHHIFANNNGAVGTIRTLNSSTSYNTSSDYRLKENVNYDFNALDRVAQLKPARFNFIANADITVDGFLAHEVQDIVPEAISGEKDAVKEEEYEITSAVLDDDGNVVTEAEMGTREVPEYQGIDQSKLVPLLTKAIQEQQTIIDDLKTRIEALEG